MAPLLANYIFKENCWLLEFSVMNITVESLCKRRLRIRCTNQKEAKLCVLAHTPSEARGDLCPAQSFTEAGPNWWLAGP